MKVIGVLLFAGCILAADREVTVGPKGQYSTVQAAVDAVPPRTVIHILPGVYKERVVVPYAKPFLTFRGDDPLTTVITNNSHAGLPGPKGPINTFATPTVFIQANDFTAQGLTFENSAGNQGQAVALTIMGDRGIFRNCRFLGYQDTLLAQAGRQYFDRSQLHARWQLSFDHRLQRFGRVRLGHGPVLTRGLGLHPGLEERLEGAARAADIPWQMEAMHVTTSTYTDVDGALDALAGTAAALVSLPLRHMHSPSEVCALDDIDQAAELIARLCLTLTPEDTWDR